MASSGEVLASAQGLQLRFSAQIVLADANLTIHAGDKLGIVGRNGSGKSSFLRILARQDQPDGGEVSWKSALITGYLPQEFALDDDATVLTNVRAGARHILDRIAAFESGEGSPARLAELQNQIEALDGWTLETRIDSAMKALHTPPPERLVADLSGGEKRRVALCRALVSQPDLLLLDEPTNHLDSESIEWLELFLQSYRGACVFVTHDRYFLDRIATRIAELDEGRFFSHDGTYSDYLAAKAERSAIAANTESRRQSFLRRELEWVRAGVQARRTKEQNRLDRFHDVAGQEGPARELDMQFIIPPAPKLGNVVVRLQDAGLELGGKQLFRGINLEFTAGTCTGVIGRNGLGKTSLLQVIMGTLEPTEGTVAIGERTSFNYADQNRLAVDGSRSMIEEVGSGSEYVTFGDQKLHIQAYLKRFMFTGEQLHARIDTLSGGERNRIMLAKLLRQGGNFLVLDEPTNDLDLSTLRLLEEAVLAFDGVVLVVSHDRYFLDRVADRIIAFEGPGRIVIQEGNYAYYVEKRAQRRSAASPAAPPSESRAAVRSRTEKPRKMTWKEERELESLEPAILTLEARIQEIDGDFASPDFFRDRGDEAAGLQAERDRLETEIGALYARWEELEQLRSQVEA